MKVEIIVSFITLFGVLFSVFISYAINKQLLKSKMTQIKFDILLQNSDRLVQNRISSYTSLYKHLSQFKRNLRDYTSSSHIPKNFRENIENLREVIIEDYASMGLLFSSQSDIYTSRLLNHLLEIKEKPTLSVENTKEIKVLIGRLEFSLKQDVGVYIDELQDIKTGKSLETYFDLLNVSKRIENVRKNSKDFRIDIDK